MIKITDWYNVPQYSKNPYPCGNRTLPNKVLGWDPNAKRWRPSAFCLQPSTEFRNAWAVLAFIPQPVWVSWRIKKLTLEETVRFQCMSHHDVNYHYARFNQRSGQTLMILLTFGTLESNIVIKTCETTSCIQVCAPGSGTSVLAKSWRPAE